MTHTLAPMTPRRRSEIRDLLVGEVARDTAPDGDARRQTPAALPGRARSRPLVACALAAAAVAIAVSADVRNPTPSYASWEATPATAPGAAVTNEQIQEWASQCSDLGVGGIGIEGVPTRAAAAKREVLVDRRGDFTFCVDVALGSGTAQDPLVALAGIRADLGPEVEDSLNTMWGTVYDEPLAEPRGGDVLVLGGDTADPPAAPEDDTATYLKAYQLYGLAGPDVDKVAIRLSTGTVVTATLQDGVWGAWWPADEGAASGSRLEVLSGSQTELVDPASVSLPSE